MTILDNSKLVMYNYWYNELIPKYGYNDLKLIYSDTDSLIVKINTDDIYKDMYDTKNLYDLSDYPKDHFLYDNNNKKVSVKFKDELNGTIIREVIAIRSKMYSILTEDLE